MREAAQHFVGKHDFSAFANATREDGAPDPLKTISRFDVIEMVKERFNHFLRKLGFRL